MSIDNILSKIGLTEDELKVYNVIVGFGFRTTGQISAYTSQELKLVQSVCKSLEEKNLILSSKGRNDLSTIYVPIAPKISISSEISQRLSERLKSLSEKVNSYWNDAQSVIDQDTRKLIQTVNHSIENYIVKLEKLASDNTDDINTWAFDINDEIKSASELLHNEFNEAVTEPLGEISQSLIQISEQINSLQQQTVAEIDSKTEFHRSLIKNSSDLIKKEVSKYSDDLGDAFTSKTDSLVKNLDHFTEAETNEVNKRINEFGTSTDKTAKQLENKIQGYDDKLIDTLNSLHQTTNASLVTQIDAFEFGIKEIIEKSQETGKQAYDLTLDSSTSLLEKYQEAQIGSVQELQEGLLQAIATVQKEAVEELTELLTTTASELTKMKETAVGKLKEHHEALDGDLTDLSTTLEKTLSTRFKEIDTKLSGFIKEMKSTASSNVSGIIKEISELNTFIQTFFAETYTSLEGYLDGLDTEVKKDMKSIIKSSNADIDELLKSNLEVINKISSEVDNRLSNFQAAIVEFLDQVKVELKEKLDNSIKLFSENVNLGVNTYEENAKSFSEIQEQQIAEIEEEADELNELADRYKGELVTFSDSTLSKVVEDRFQQFNEAIQSSMEKIQKQMVAFHEDQKANMQNFNGDFVNQTSGIREKIPLEIDKLFSDQIQQLSNFRLEFDRLSTFIEQSLGHMEDLFRPKSKVNFKKVRDDYYQEILRNRDEFDRLSRNISTHFDGFGSELEDTKNSVLNDITQTIQNTLAELDDLVQDNSRQTQTLIGNFSNKLNENQQSQINSVQNSLEELHTSIQSQLTGNMLTMFEQPITNLMNKAKHLAKGYEGVDKENRLLIVQNLLITAVQNAVDSLVISLQDSFVNSIVELDVKMEETTINTQSMINGLRNDIEEEFENQQNNATELTKELKSKLSKVTKSIGSKLGKHLKETKASVSKTVNERKTEIDQTVIDRTSTLDTQTKENMKEIDMSLKKFTKDFNKIQLDTKKKIKSTVKQSVKTQYDSMVLTQDKLAGAVDSATTQIEVTSNSLQEKVKNPLIAIENDVNAMLESFESSTQNATDLLKKQTGGHYKAVTKELSKLSKIMKDGQTSNSGMKNSIEILTEEEMQALKKLLTEHKNERLGIAHDFSNKLEHLSKDLSTNLATFISDHNSKVKDKVIGAHTEIEETTTEVKTHIQGTVNAAMDKIETDVLNPITNLIDTVTAVSQSSTATLNELSSSFKVLNEGKTSLVTKSKEGFAGKLEKTVKREQDKWINKASRNYKNQIDSITTLGDEFEKTVSSVSSEGKTKVTNAFKSIPNTIDETLDAAAKSIALLNEISKGSSELEPRIIEHSYIDASKEALIANLNSTLSHTKSSLSIVSPTLEWIDEKIITNLTRASVRIYTDPKQHSPTDKRIVEVLRNSENNIALREIDRSRYRGEDLIMIDRDKEEVILGKILEDKDPFCFVTQDDQFIEKFSILFSEFQTMPKLK